MIPEPDMKARQWLSFVVLRSLGNDIDDCRFTAVLQDFTFIPQLLQAINPEITQAVRRGHVSATRLNKIWF